MRRGVKAYGQKKGSIFEELVKEANVHLAVIEKHWKIALEKLPRAPSVGAAKEAGSEGAVLEDADEFY